jgi:hypothetical protein
MGWGCLNDGKTPNEAGRKAPFPAGSRVGYPASDPPKTWALRRGEMTRNLATNWMNVNPFGIPGESVRRSIRVRAGAGPASAHQKSPADRVLLTLALVVGTLPLSTRTRGGVSLLGNRRVASFNEPKARCALTWYSGPESVRRAAIYGGIQYNAPHELCPPSCGGSKRGTALRPLTLRGANLVSPPSWRFDHIPTGAAGIEMEEE